MASAGAASRASSSPAPRAVMIRAFFILPLPTQTKHAQSPKARDWFGVAMPRLAREPVEFRRYPPGGRTSVLRHESGAVALQLLHVVLGVPEHELDLFVGELAHH